MINLKRHDKIKAALLRRGLTLAGLGASLTPPCSGPAVTRVSQGWSRSARIEAALAEALETTPEALFPERYRADEPWATGRAAA